MIRLLLTEIAYMAVMAILGAFNFLMLQFDTEWWLELINFVCGLFVLILAWRSYRNAREIAATIDDYLHSINRQLGNYQTLFNIIFNGKESKSESKGQGEEQAEASTKTEADREDESEDYCASPI